MSIIFFYHSTLDTLHHFYICFVVGLFSYFNLVNISFCTLFSVFRNSTYCLIACIVFRHHAYCDFIFIIHGIRRRHRRRQALLDSPKWRKKNKGKHSPKNSTEPLIRQSVDERVCYIVNIYGPIKEIE